MKKNIIYNELAKFYDYVYAYKNYEKEATQIKRLIKKYKKTKGRKMLEVACGTGRYTKFFTSSFNILGTDSNEEMIKIAREKVSRATFKKADMKSLDLGEKFDVIVCLFSSIGYLKNYKELNEVARRFSEHLLPGGVVIVEPWFTEETYMIGHPHMDAYKDKNIVVVRSGVFKRRGITSVLDMHYIISERDKETRHFVDRHELAMFDLEKMKEIFEKFDISIKILSKGRKRRRKRIVGVKKPLI